MHQGVRVCAYRLENEFVQATCLRDSCNNQVSPVVSAMGPWSFSQAATPFYKRSRNAGYNN